MEYDIQVKLLAITPNSANLLETAGRHWVVKRVADIASISNCLTITDNYDDSSPGLEEYAREKGYCKKGKNLNFKRELIG